MIYYKSKLFLKISFFIKCAKTELPNEITPLELSKNTSKCDCAVAFPFHVPLRCLCSGVDQLVPRKSMVRHGMIFLELERTVDEHNPGRRQRMAG